MSNTSIVENVAQKQMYWLRKTIKTVEITLLCGCFLSSQILYSKNSTKATESKAIQVSQLPGIE